MGKLEDLVKKSLKLKAETNDSDTRNKMQNIDGEYN